MQALVQHFGIIEGEEVFLIRFKSRLFRFYVYVYAETVPLTEIEIETEIWRTVFVCQPLKFHFATGRIFLNKTSGPDESTYYVKDDTFLPLRLSRSWRIPEIYQAPYELGKLIKPNQDSVRVRICYVSLS